MTRREESIEAEVSGMPEWAQQEFRRIVANGNTREFALMAVSRRGPVMGNCDRAFCELQNDAMKRDMSEETRKMVLGEAHRAGINTEGKTYCGAIGKYDDPLAWVSSRDDAVAACRAKGISTDGTLKVKCPSRAPKLPEKRFLAKDLIEEGVNNILKTDPKVRARYQRGKVKRGDLRERVVAEHGPPR